MRGPIKSRQSMRKKSTKPKSGPSVVMHCVVGALAKEWTGIARELVEDTTELPMIIHQIRSREIQLCRWHAKQLRNALRKCSND